MEKLFDQNFLTKFIFFLQNYKINQEIFYMCHAHIQSPAETLFFKDIFKINFISVLKNENHDIKFCFSFFLSCYTALWY
jgi:hypothetical protein